MEQVPNLFLQIKTNFFPHRRIFRRLFFFHQTFSNDFVLRLVYLIKWIRPHFIQYKPKQKLGERRDRPCTNITCVLYEQFQYKLTFNDFCVRINSLPVTSEA